MFFTVYTWIKAKMAALQRAIHSPTNRGGGMKETERKEEVETMKAEREQKKGN